MKIQVENLGAIKNARINLDKPLTLFCGQNNTGKTYLAYIIYALTKLKVSKSPLKLNVSQLIENGFVELDLNIKELFDFKNRSIDQIKLNLNTIFGISEDVASQIFSDFSITFDVDINNFNSKVISIDFDDILDINEQRLKIIKQVGSLRLRVELVEDGDYKELINSEFMGIIISSIIANKVVYYPISNAVIFSVERNSIFTFSKELSLNRNLLIDQMQKLSKGDKISPFDMLMNSTNRYPIAISDGLSVSNDLQNIQKKNSEFYSFATEIEEDLLHGTLIVTKEGDMQFSSNRNKGKKLPIHMSASIVKTLSSLVFYLKHIAEKSDLIIIDEPEMNLHPDSQRILAKVFAKLLNQGFRLLISTHSDYIIREFNNLIMTSHNKPEIKELASKLGYNTDESIQPEQVGCYYFHFPRSTSRQLNVVELSVDEAGFEVPSIDETIEKQNQYAEELFYTLKYGNADE
ncbi:MAG: AAA family ATPase [Paludibacter sp.]|jgi:predicted ATPase|nr:AAA family ATPase [Paludibacter sp.]